jgi:hypothetical protein
MAIGDPILGSAKTTEADGKATSYLFEIYPI